MEILEAAKTVAEWIVMKRAPSFGVTLSREDEQVVFILRNAIRKD